jgi:hypothetical protein
MGVPINRAAWSLSSQRAIFGDFDLFAEEYEGGRCRCSACLLSFVLTPEARRIALEVEKKYVWWLPSRCPDCAARLAPLQVLDKAFQARWNASRGALKSDRQFIGEWLAVLREMATLAKGNSMQIHLERLLQE